MKPDIIILDFSGIYQEEGFYKEEQVSWVDLRGISGTNCYCDGEAQGQILDRLEKYPVSGIYFIDSGNYHYMSLFICWFLIIIRICSCLLLEGFCPAEDGSPVPWRR